MVFLIGIVVIVMFTIDQEKLVDSVEQMNRGKVPTTTPDQLVASIITPGMLYIVILCLFVLPFLSFDIISYIGYKQARSLLSLAT